MKVSFLVGTGVGPTVEGKTQVSMKIKNFLEKKGFKILINSQDADIFHSHSLGFYDSFILNKIKKKKQAPCIYSLYSTCSSDLFGYLRNEYEELSYSSFKSWGTFNFFFGLTSVLPLRLRAGILKNFDQVIVPSETIKNQLFGNTKVIHVGIDTTRFRRYKQLEKPHDTLNIVYAGHFCAFKGITDYITASKKLKNCNVNMHFISIDEASKNKIRRMNPKIKIFGYQKNIEKVYNEMDVMILPYRTGLGAIANPFVLLEAMACERAVITTNIPNIKEITKDTAVLIEPYSPNAIVDAIEELRDERKRRILGKKARQRIVEQYDEKKMFNEYLKVYEELSKTI